jgi:pyruvate dehydrogenase E2 component (dihydrolipoamide acetyltransferase)
MARVELKLTDIGEGVVEGEIVRWLVRPGDAVVEDQPMVEVMTDKATVVIAAPRAGRVEKVAGDAGTTVAVGGVLVVLSVAEGTPGPSDTAASACGDIRDELPSVGGGKPLATPATRKLARDLGVDLKNVSSTGGVGRITSADVRAAATASRAESTAGDARTAVPVEARAAARTEAVRDEVRIPLRGLRKRIFENMAVSMSNAAHSTFVEECDVTGLKALRERLKPRALAAGLELSFLPIIVKAVAVSLRRHPRLNATFDGAAQEIVLLPAQNIGIATATEAGLVVPVLHDAANLGLIEIGREIDRMAADARSQRILPEDIAGGTFTITSLGAIGGLMATPVIRFPEVAILGVHKMRERPVVRDGQIVIGDVMLLSLTFDHRLIDGHVAAAFVYEVIGYLERPETLLLES